MSTYKIVLDAMGNDSGCATIIRGAALALKKHADLTLVLVGEEAHILRECEAEQIDMGRIEIVSATEVITNDCDPVSAIFQKRDSSLVKALIYAGEHEDIVGIVNAGNTGALVVGSARYLTAKTKKRPMLAAILPKESGGYVCLCDTGATVDCTPEMLLQFAKESSAFMKKMYGIESPGGALLSNGAEDTKGNKLVKESFPLLRACEEIRFVGNVEGSDALSGKCDVVVCDGFAGNQVLKVTEGTARRLIRDIVKMAKETKNKEYMSLAEKLMAKYDFNSLGGAIILGTSVPIIKAHGRANEQSIISCISMLLNFAKNNSVYETIVE